MYKEMCVCKKTRNTYIYMYICQVVVSSNFFSFSFQQYDKQGT